MINISKNVKKPSQILNVYLVEREDECDYDETRALAIVAESEEQALRIADNDYYGEWKIEAKIDLTKPQVILEDVLEG